MRHLRIFALLMMFALLIPAMLTVAMIYRAALFISAGMKWLMDAVSTMIDEELGIKREEDA